MKTQLLKFQRMRSTERVFEKFPDEIDGKPEIRSAIDKFASNNSRISELISELVRPRSVIFLPKQEAQKKLRTTAKRMAGLGILIATRRQNPAKCELYKMFNRLITRSASWNLHNQVVQVSDELQKDQEAAAEVGLTAEKLIAFQEMTQQFGATLETTDKLLKQRKAISQELDALLSENTTLLLTQLDPFVAFEQEVHPALYREYIIARKENKIRKASTETELTAEISGTVTDKASGEAVGNATVLLSKLEMMTTTDADGYYLLEDVPPGKYSLSCHAAGYKLPADFDIEVSDTISLQVDFSLEAESSAGIAV
jgi:hypothetical protein